ncbi:hypothetical protein IMZ48_45325, partial [Candidatus Bathyarchaeota archaeon]|nr:hypothetical protein [Candidatus Bathyarchaeota archaeon]
MEDGLSPAALLFLKTVMSVRVTNISEAGITYEFDHQIDRPAAELQRYFGDLAAQSQAGPAPAAVLA